jgi:hypothetical protein
MTKGFAESAFLGPWEVEDNDDCRANQVNGLLTSGRQYYGYSDDKWDYFGIDLHSGGKILTGLTIAPTRHLQLVLLDKDCKVLDPYAWDPPYLVEIPDASAGQYYIGVFMESGYTLDQPYILWAEFP